MALVEQRTERRKRLSHFWRGRTERRILLFTRWRRLLLGDDTFVHIVREVYFWMTLLFTLLVHCSLGYHTFGTLLAHFVAHFSSTFDSPFLFSEGVYKSKCI